MNNCLHHLLMAYQRTNYEMIFHLDYVRCVKRSIIIIYGEREHLRYADHMLEVYFEE